MKLPKIATVWLEGCSGCHMSFLDMDENLLNIFSRVELTDSPITDFKDFNFQDVANQVMIALAEKLSIQKDQIALISVQSVVWSDSSLGCPQPDMNYLMVLTDGYRVVLAVDDEPYYYHANTKGYGVICESPNPPYSEGAVDR